MRPTSSSSPISPKSGAPASSLTATGPSWRRGSLLLLPVLVLGALVLRIFAGSDQFWYDEIWSLSLAQNAHSPLDVVTKIHHDNNHLLNTYVMYAIGPDVYWFWYRLPAMLAGVGGVIACGLLARSFGAVTTILVVVLSGASYLMVHYTSEARGYAYLLMLAPLSVYFLCSAHERAKLWNIALFNISTALGCFAHVTFYFCLLACLAYSLAQIARRGGERKKQLAVAFACYPLPLLFALGLYSINYREMLLGGSVGEFFGPAQGMGLFLSLLVGGPREGAGMWVAAACCVGLVGAGVWLLCRRDPGWGAFFGVLIVGLLGVVKFQSASAVYCRYYLVWLPFFELAVAVVLGRLWSRGSSPRLISAAVALALVSSNSWHTARLMRVGRGDYATALALIRNNSTEEQIFVTSDNDLSAMATLQFYGYWDRDPTKHLNYKPHRFVTAEGVDWIIVHQEAPPDAPDIPDPFGNRYKLVKVFPFAGLSGFYWSLYQRDRGLGGG